MHKRTKKLRALMGKHSLTPAQVADLLGRSEMTVRIWLCKTTASKTIPAQLLELLELKAWHAAAIKEGLADAVAGRMKPLEEVREKFAAAGRTIRP